ncbi:hypothetical protein D3P96_01745 [Weissella viridescens]|uniref:Uncharacterized protein n=1 Tax=Weissella viridescens TaxID=1629 RepID=A0A3P2RM22_WEIVI|nr:hypothetical protein [Weissella viridescens]RRG18732.1 hypothetical protein D3P96_01745 [Weissella viridescens]
MSTPNPTPKKQQPIYVPIAIIIVSVIVIFGLAFWAISTASKNMTAGQIQRPSSAKVDKDTYTMYEATDIKTDSNNQGDIIIKGKTNAPDDSVVLVAPTDKASLETNSNAALNTKNDGYATVENGKFKASVSIVDLAVNADKIKTDQKFKVKIVAAANYDKSIDDSIEKMLDGKDLSLVPETTVKADGRVAQYFNSLEDEDDADANDDSDTFVTNSEALVSQYSRVEELLAMDKQGVADGRLDRDTVADRQEAYDEKLTNIEGSDIDDDKKAEQMKKLSDGIENDIKNELTNGQAASDPAAANKAFNDLKKSAK